MAPLSRSRYLTGLAAFGTALLWAYWPTLEAMAAKWSMDPQYSHGFIVPAFAAYLLWHRRSLLPASLPAPSTGTAANRRRCRASPCRRIPLLRCAQHGVHASGSGGALSVLRWLVDAALGVAVHRIPRVHAPVALPCGERPFPPFAAFGHLPEHLYAADHRTRRRLRGEHHYS